MSTTPMPVEVILTGTGTPNSDAERAGPGVLVRTPTAALQFDAGRGTVMRLAAVHQRCADLSAVFLTHHHSDHLLSLDDVILTAWLGRREPLVVIAPEGPAARFARHVLDVWGDDIAVRTEHMHRPDAPRVDVRAFAPSSTPVEVWSNDDVAVHAVAVHHEPVVPAVAYRIDTGAGSVVVSGDTRVCAEVERLATGASVLVHEIVRAAGVSGSLAERIYDYHADSVGVGALARRAGVATLMLTHFLPAPASDDDLACFVDDVRRGGYEGEILAGADLTTKVL